MPAPFSKSPISSIIAGDLFSGTFMRWILSRDSWIMKYSSSAAGCSTKYRRTWYFVFAFDDYLPKSRLGQPELRISTVAEPPITTVCFKTLNSRPFVQSSDRFLICNIFGMNINGLSITKHSVDTVNSPYFKIPHLFGAVQIVTNSEWNKLSSE